MTVVVGGKLLDFSRVELSGARHVATLWVVDVYGTGDRMLADETTVRVEVPAHWTDGRWPLRPGLSVWWHGDGDVVYVGHDADMFRLVKVGPSSAAPCPEER